jgi:hypothetical protein
VGAGGDVVSRDKRYSRASIAGMIRSWRVRDPSSVALISIQSVRQFMA